MRPRKLKCTSSMRAWAAVAEEVDVIFANNLGDLIEPGPGLPICMTTHPGLLTCTVLSLQKFCLGRWGDRTQYRRMGNTDHFWEFAGDPFTACRHHGRHNLQVLAQCQDPERVQALTENSRMKALFHRLRRAKENMFVDAKAVAKGDIWAAHLWPMKDGCKLEWEGAVRFGKVKRGKPPISIRKHGAPHHPHNQQAPPLYVPSPSQYSPGSTLESARLSSWSVCKAAEIPQAAQMVRAMRTA
ncbi:MAG: hypothetical protein M1839_009368 [Geoglossum umbratile]|nr:MAG: hypothetical protein M1839_009368 [Geoglossum umbratile]